MRNFVLDPTDLQGMEAHLLELGWISGTDSLSAEPIGQGNMNLTLRVRTNQRSFILKQARPWVEKYPTIKAPVERAAIEATFYRIVRDHRKLAARMPRFLGFDEAANLLCLEDMGEEGDFTSSYGAGGLEEINCRVLTEYLSSLHEIQVSPKDLPILRNRAMRSLNHEHQYDLPLKMDSRSYLDGITNGLSDIWKRLRSDPQYCAGVRGLGQIYLADGSALVHGDFFPGSWLRTQEGPLVIDGEFCFLGPPEYDLGIFLAHLEFLGVRSLWSVVETSYRGMADWQLVRRFSGAEIMRRLIGVAQLPIVASLENKRQWLELSRSLVCAG